MMPLAKSCFYLHLFCFVLTEGFFFFFNDRGEIVKESEDVFLSKGRVTAESKSSLRISELPVGRWTQDYKEFLDELARGEGTKQGQENLIRSYTEHHTG